MERDCPLSASRQIRPTVRFGARMTTVSDRRQQRTRDAIRRAFIALADKRRYEDFSVADLVAEANIGRSTFYEHYRSKDDVLRTLMDGMLAELADASNRKI